MKTYGFLEKADKGQKNNQNLEELRIRGFTVLSEVINESQLSECRRKLDEVYAVQKEEFGVERLKAINEENLARSPLSYDPFFVDLALHKVVVDLAHEAIGGGYVLLHLQNGIINHPKREHHQSSWHRDLPYQEFVSSRPLAIGALFCIDDFTKETGCTYVLPFSHREEKFPSDEYVAMQEVPVEAPAGSVILFDAMLFHRAGHNTSNRIRRGVNHVYSIPIIKQQIELMAASYVKARTEIDPWAAKILGIGQAIPKSVAEFRENRIARLKILPRQ